MNKKPLPVNLSKREFTWGLRYLLFELVFLGSLLSYALSLFISDLRSVHVNTAFFIINFAAVLGIFHRYLRLSLKHSLTHWGKLLIAAGIGFAVYWVLIIGLDALIYRLFPEFQNVNDAGIAQNVNQQFWITAIGTVILVPPTEEILFRGLIFGALHQRNRAVAYLISVLFFAFIHVMGYIGAAPVSVLMLGFLQYIPAGLIMAWSYEFSGSILAPILIHMAVNAIAILSMR